jgi:hypothetical protein
MQRRVACAASDDIIVGFRVQLLSDGTVIVMRDVAAHKQEGSSVFMQSSFFEVSASGVKSHVWMSQARDMLQLARLVCSVLNDSRLSNHRHGCMCVRTTMARCWSYR